MNNVEIEDLRVCYGGRHIKEAVRGLSFTVSEGRIFGFLGPNGAGKTTTIKAMLGLIPGYKGKIVIIEYANRCSGG